MKGCTCSCVYFSIKTCWLGSVGFSSASSVHQALMWEVLGKRHIACGVWQSGWCSVHADELRLWGSCSRYAVTSTVAILADWRCMQIKHLPKWKRNVYITHYFTVTPNLWEYVTSLPTFLAWWYYLGVMMTGNVHKIWMVCCRTNHQ